MFGTKVEGDCEASRGTDRGKGKVCALGASKGLLGFMIKQADGGVQLETEGRRGGFGGTGGTGIEVKGDAGSYGAAGSTRGSRCLRAGARRRRARPGGLGTGGYGGTWAAARVDKNQLCLASDSERTPPSRTWTLG